MNNRNDWNETEKRLRTYINDSLRIPSTTEADYNEETELVESRILSSLALVNLLAGIENLLESEIVTDDVGIEEFSSIGKIIGSVKKSFDRMQKEGP